MPEVPKIVHHRMQAAAPGQYLPGQAHPEADLLCAFAEQALSPAERDSVLQHLALCADCRDVVALALPAADPTASPVEAGTGVAAAPSTRGKSTSTNWSSWANLHWAQLSWAALAAGIAVAVLVVRPELGSRVTPSHPASALASQPAAPSAAASQVASSAMPERTRADQDIEAKTAAVGARNEFSSHKLQAGQAAPSPQPRPHAPAAGDMLAGNMKKDLIATDKLASVPAFGARALDAPRSINETVAVSGAATVATTDSSVSGNLVARDEAPAIEKAKPALGDTTASELQKAIPERTPATAQSYATAQGRSGMSALRAAAPQITTLKQNANWAIVAGVLQRSLDGGQSWQAAVKADHALLCYANPNRSQEVWAGGRAGTLLHSTDAGTTWSAVGVSFKGQPLSSDVTHIDVRSPAEIVLATNDNQTWSSADGGKTWEKK